MLVQLIFAAVLLLGLGWFTGLINWPKILPVISFSDPGPQTQPRKSASRSADDPDQGVLTRAFEATAHAPRKEQRGSGTNTRDKSACARDSTRIRALAQQYGWETRILRLVACGQVRAGFSEEQARTALGAPARIEQEADGEIWVYDNVRLIVRDGRVSSVQR